MIIHLKGANYKQLRAHMSPHHFIHPCLCTIRSILETINSDVDGNKLNNRDFLSVMINSTAKSWTTQMKLRWLNAEIRKIDRRRRKDKGRLWLYFTLTILCPCVNILNHKLVLGNNHLVKDPSTDLFSYFSKGCCIKTWRFRFSLLYGFCSHFHSFCLLRLRY